MERGLIDELFFRRRRYGGGIAPILKTATGNPIHITDALARAVDSLKVEFAPIQDLHGQDAPYPAGGGKNLLGSTLEQLKAANAGGTWTDNVFSTNGMTFTVSFTDGYAASILIKGTASTQTNFFMRKSDDSVVLTDGTAYTINGCPTNGSVNSYGLYATSQGITDYGGGAKFTASSSETYVGRIRIANGYSAPTEGIEFKPMIRLTSVTDASFAPYSNICPISGWTGANVTRAGKNLFDPTAKFDSSWTLSAGASLPTLTVNRADFANDTLTVTCGAAWSQGNAFLASGLEQGSTYKLTGTLGIDADKILRCTLFALDKDLKVTRTVKYFVNAGSIDESITIATGEVYLALSLVSGNDYAVITLQDPCVSFDGVYAPYSGTSLLIPFTVNGDTKTIYGGYLTIAEDGSVKLTATMAEEIYDGSEDEAWERWQSGSASAYAMRILASNVKGSTWLSATAISNYLVGIGAGVTWGDYDSFVSTTNNQQNYIITGVRNITTVADWKTYLASNNLQVVYELAIPVEYDLADVTPLTLLANENNLWSDTNGDLTLSYYADGNVSTIEALNTLLGGRYVNNHESDEPTDEEALNIILGESR